MPIYSYYVVKLWFSMRGRCQLHGTPYHHDALRYNLQSCPWVDVCRIERRSTVVAELPRAHHRWNLKQQNVDMAPGNRRQSAVNHYIGGKL